MKILVPVKRVLDYNVKIRIKSDCSDVDLSNVKMALNPFCEIAIEEALRLKESGVATEVIVVSIGPKEVQEQIRTALALGADRGLHVETDEMPESFNAAKIIAKLVETEKPDMVILGKQSIDSDNNQTGQMVAALCGYAQGTFASNVEVLNDQAIVTREVDGGLQTLSLTLPAVITADLRLNEPRYASLANIMKAKRKTIEHKTPVELGLSLRSHAKILSVTPPKERSSGMKISNINELIEKLTSEAKVI